MKYCGHCGAEVKDGANYCTKCGEPLNTEASKVETAPEYVEQARECSTDSGSFAWAVLGFFFPVVGLVLYLVWQYEKPRNALMAGKGALVSAILNVCAYIITAGFLVSTIASMPLGLWG